MATQPDGELIKKVMLGGDLSTLTPEQRVTYYEQVCEVLGINPLTKPLDYIVLDGKLTLYAKKDATEQLRKRYDLSCKILSREQQETIYIVTAQASFPNGGRTDEAIGAVSITQPERIRRKQPDGRTAWVDNPGAGKPLPGGDLANAVMKAETKAKRRVTLSICGLGMLDESELDAIDYGGELDQRTPSEIAERNVKQATENAVAEREPGSILSLTIKTVGDVTKDNYKEVLCHVGKESGIKWKKVGELHQDVIKWLYNNWRNNLRPNATADDFKLKRAIELAYEKLSGESDTLASAHSDGGASVAHLASDSEDSASPAVPPSQDVGAKQAAITDLRGRIEELILTEAQAVSFCVKQGIANEGWTTFDQMPEGILLHLCTPQGWKTFKTLIEAEVRPKEKAATPKSKKARRQ